MADYRPETYGERIADVRTDFEVVDASSLMVDPDSGQVR